MEGIWRQKHPGATQETPRDRQEAPRRHPGDPQEAPRRFPGPPRGVQRHPFFFLGACITRMSHVQSARQYRKQVKEDVFDIHPSELLGPRKDCRWQSGEKLPMVET